MKIDKIYTVIIQDSSIGFLTQKERDAWMMEQYHMYKISANRPFKTFKEYWEGAEMLTIPIIRMKIFEGGTK
jgi:hypothetical protein